MEDVLQIVARIEAAPGQAEALEKDMRILVAETRQEEGCLRYDLNRGTENPDIFVFVEEWQSKALWEAHMNGEAIRAFNQRIGSGKIAQGEIIQLHRVV